MNRMDSEREDWLAQRVAVAASRVVDTNAVIEVTIG
jgi:hypothetical protein